MLCPAKCGNSLLFVSAGLTCRCGYSIDYRGNILDFVGPKGIGSHQTSSGSAADGRAFQELIQVLRRIGKKEIPVTVEFGAGHSAWTAGMAESKRFREVYAIDVSFPSQREVGKSPSRDQTHFVRQLPENVDFAPASVDVVAGRSFLRHIADYEGLLAKCARWLRPDGAAIFYEPCIQGKIWIGFLTKLLLELDIPPETKARESIVWDAMRHNLEKLYKKDIEQSQLAGKWIFDMDALRETAQKTGFPVLQVLDEDGRLLRSFKRKIFGAIGDRANLKRCNAAFEGLGDVFSNSAPKMLVSPMVFFVFRKRGPGYERVTKQRVSRTNA